MRDKHAEALPNSIIQHWKQTGEPVRMNPPAAAADDDSFYIQLP